MLTFVDRAKNIKLMIFDVDGVLTDGAIYYTNKGEEFKAFNILDGQGMKMLKASGVELAIISGRASHSVELRAQDLGIKFLQQAVEDKYACYLQLVTSVGLTAEQTGYIGDDLADLPVMRHCRLAVSVPEAPEIIKRHAHYVTQAGGGRGAAREICELIMQAQNSYEKALSKYL